MEGELTFEFEPPIEGKPCEESGHISVWLTRFVYREGDAFAIAKAVFPKNICGAFGLLSVTLGDWSDDAPNESRVAFLMQVFARSEQNCVSILEGEVSPWADREHLGVPLSRNDALAHPWITDAYAVFDRMTEADTDFMDLLAKTSLPADASE